MNPDKGHIVFTRWPVLNLGYLVTRAGYDLDRKSFKRMRWRLLRLSRGSLAKLERTLAGWRGAVLF